MSGIKIHPQPIVPSFPSSVGPKPAEGNKESFGDFLADAIKGVESLQGEAGEAQDALVRGQAAELHQVMIAAEKAGISFDLLLEVRKKLLEAYQDIIRMPV